MNIHLDPRTVISSAISKKEFSADDKRARDLESLREYTREFEALYMNEVLKAMRKTIPENSIFGTNSATEMYQEMLDMEMAKETAKGRGVGLGLAMYNQMKGLIENKRY